VASNYNERGLALSYAVEGGAAAAAIFALDDRLAEIVRAARDPLIGRMRLTWWHDALCALDEAPAPAEPILQALAREALPRGVSGAVMAPIAAGWEALLEQPLDAEAVARHGERGRALFAAVGRAIRAGGDPLEFAGAGWALADLSRHVTNPSVGQIAASQAAPLLNQALAVRWSRHGRSLGALAHLAQLDIERPGEGPGAARRVWRMLRHRLTGR